MDTSRIPHSAKRACIQINEQNASAYLRISRRNLDCGCSRSSTVWERGLHNAGDKGSFVLRHASCVSVGSLAFPTRSNAPRGIFFGPSVMLQGTRHSRHGSTHACWSPYSNVTPPPSSEEPSNGGNLGRPSPQRELEHHGDDAPRRQWPQSVHNGCRARNQQDSDGYGSPV